MVLRNALQSSNVETDGIFLAAQRPLPGQACLCQPGLPQCLAGGIPCQNESIVVGGNLCRGKRIAPSMIFWEGIRRKVALWPLIALLAVLGLWQCAQPGSGCSTAECCCSSQGDCQSSCLCAAQPTPLPVALDQVHPPSLDIALHKQEALPPVLTAPVALFLWEGSSRVSPKRGSPDRSRAPPGLA